MAVLIIDQKEYPLKDGSPIAEICEQAGVPFSCHSGVCGTCQIEIVDGQENLNPVNQSEDDMGMDRNNRLCCQSVIRHGRVTITY